MEVKELLADRSVRILCDIGSEGIWDREGVPRDLEFFPIAEVLKARIMAWQAWYEQDDPHENPPVQIDWEAFSEEGRQIARAIKQTLPDWTVIYFDEHRCRTRSANAPRIHYEYEIILSEPESPVA